MLFHTYKSFCFRIIGAIYCASSMQGYMLVFLHVHPTIIYRRLNIYHGCSKLENITKYTIVMHSWDSYDHLIVYNRIIKNPTTQKAQKFIFCGNSRWQPPWTNDMNIVHPLLLHPYSPCIDVCAETTKMPWYTYAWHFPKLCDEWKRQVRSTIGIFGAPSPHIFMIAI